MSLPTGVDPALFAELDRREKERPSDFWKFKATKAQLAFHKDTHKKRVVFGGNRSGKTLCGAVEVIWWATNSHPFRKVPPKSRIWVVGVDFPTLRDGLKKEYFDQLLPVGCYQWHEGDYLYEITRGPGKGSIIGLKSADSARTKFQSVARDLVWFDEEPPEDIYHECLARTLDCGGETMLTFTPLQGMTWTFKRLYKNEENDAEISSHCFLTTDNPVFGGREKAEAAIKSTYVGVSPEELEARLFGKYMPMAGRPVFDRMGLQALRPHCVQGRVGELITVGEEGNFTYEFRSKERINKERDAYLEVWADPELHHEYAVGVDTAEGLEHGDFSTVWVFDRHVGQFVAEWHGHIDPDLLARRIVEPIARWFNEALVIPEDNNHGQVVIATLKQTYSNIYVRRVLDNARTEIQSAYGFRTSVRSKAPLIDGLVEYLRGVKPDQCPVPESLIYECETYIRDEKGHMNAQTGCYDDRIIGAGLAIFAHKTLPEVDPIRTLKSRAGNPQNWIWEMRRKKDEEDKYIEELQKEGLLVYDLSEEEKLWEQAD